jgi:multidrug resistance efflux pump
MRVDQARAAVRGLEAKLDLTADQVAAQTSKADAAASGINTAEAQRALVASTLGRMEPLLGRGFVTAQQVDQARTAQRTAQLGLRQARLQADEARRSAYPAHGSNNLWRDVALARLALWGRCSSSPASSSSTGGPWAIRCVDDENPPHLLILLRPAAPP